MTPPPPLPRPSTKPKSGKIADRLAEDDIFLMAPPSNEPLRIQLFRLQDYILNLSLAKLAYERDGDSVSAQTPLAIVNAYGAQLNGASQLQPIIVLEYKNKSSPVTERVAAPLNMPVESSDFEPLAQLTQAMPKTLQLQDIRLGVITVPAADYLPLGADETPRRLESLIGSPTDITAMANAKTNIALTRFFIAHRMKDAAYITSENAKHSLVAVDTGSPEKQEIAAALSQELQTLEGELRKTMPITLGR